MCCPITSGKVIKSQ